LSLDKFLLVLVGTAVGVDPGSDFEFRFNVVPGDVDGNGGVNFGDYLQTRALVGTVAGGEGYDPRFDVDGNGGINFGDALLTRGAVGSVLPTEEPDVLTAPTPAPGLGGGRVPLETSPPAHMTQIIGTGVALVLTTGTNKFVTVTDVASNGPPQKTSTGSLEATPRTSAPLTIATEESDPPKSSLDGAVAVRDLDVQRLRESRIAILRARDAVLAALAAPAVTVRIDPPAMIVGTVGRRLPQLAAPIASNVGKSIAVSAVTPSLNTCWESLVDATYSESTIDDMDNVEVGVDVHPLMAPSKRLVHRPADNIALRMRGVPG
jgi:hypothetical protein